MKNVSNLYFVETQDHSLSDNTQMIIQIIRNGAVLGIRNYTQHTV